MRSRRATQVGNEPSRRGLAQRVLWLGALLLLGAGLAGLEYTICPFANLVGHPCPGCGMTRAAVALARLDLPLAIALHPLSVLCVPLVVMLAFRGAHTYVLGHPPRWTRGFDLLLVRSGLAANQNLLWIVLILLLVGVWLARALGALGGPVDILSSPTSPRLLGS